MKAKDLMQPIRAALRSDQSLSEAVRLLQTAPRNDERQGVKGLPVLDESGRLLGLLTMQDILKAVHPAYLSMGALGGLTWDGMVESLACKAGGDPVETHMSRGIAVVHEQDALMECVDAMIKHNVRHLPVLNGEKKLVGMIYERDLFGAVTRAMLNENPACPT